MTREDPARAAAPSAPAATFDTSPVEKLVDERHHEQIDATMMTVERARARAERAAAALRADGADEHLIEALERAERELSNTGRALMQGALFAAPSVQTSL